MIFKLLLLGCISVFLLLPIVQCKNDESEQLDSVADDESFDEDGAEEGNQTPDDQVPKLGPCAGVRCGPGRVCLADGEEVGQCVCIASCPLEKDERRKVCSSQNETWPSDCALYRMRCLCTEGSEQCEADRYEHVHVDYYGQCRELPTCSRDEMSDFPRRMREWLHAVMRDLAEREQLRGVSLQLEREAEQDRAKRWSNAALWKFCDLDAQPADRWVSRHELFPLRAPLLSLEHCIAPFLDGCDADGDHRVSLAEWADCLGLQHDEMEDKCAAIRAST